MKTYISFIHIQFHLTLYSEYRFYHPCFVYIFKWTSLTLLLLSIHRSVSSWPTCPTTVTTASACTPSKAWWCLSRRGRTWRCRRCRPSSWLRSTSPCSPPKEIPSGRWDEDSFSYIFPFLDMLRMYLLNKAHTKIHHTMLCQWLLRGIVIKDSSVKHLVPPAVSPAWTCIRWAGSLRQQRI